MLLIACVYFIVIVLALLLLLMCWLLMCLVCCLRLVGRYTIVVVCLFKCFELVFGLMCCFRAGACFDVSCYLLACVLIIDLVC